MYRPQSSPVQPAPSAQERAQQTAGEAVAIITLTSREKEALLWSAKGKSSWEISRIFNCTEAGVNYHFSNIRRKFGVSSRWAAAMMALEQGLIRLH